MVQIIIWNGEDRPPIIKIDGSFSDGVPSVGDILTVRRSDAAVGQIELKRIQAVRKRAFFEITAGDDPQAGDIIRLPAAQNPNGGNSDALVESVNHSPARRGDIIDFLDDGIHAGNKVVSTGVASDPCDWSTRLGRATTNVERAAGENPDFVIIDVAGVTAEQARVALANRAATLFGYAGTPVRLPGVIGGVLRLEYEDLSVAARNLLRDNGRVTATAAQVVPFLGLKKGIVQADIENQITANGEDPDQLTTYL